MRGNSLTQPNLQPKTENKLIKEIFVLTTRAGRWQSSKRAVWARLLIVRSPEAQINSSGVRWLLVTRIWFFEFEWKTVD